MPEIPVAVQSNVKTPTPNSGERLINYYADPAAGNARYRVPIIGAAGLRLWTDIRTAPLRGRVATEAYLFVVAGSKLLRIDRDQAIMDLGTVGGLGRVQMATNGNQVAIVTRNGAGYIATAETLQLIEDPDYHLASSVTYVDGFFVFGRKGTGEFFISKLLDGSTFDGLDFAEAESDPDTLISVFETHQELWLFGRRSIEVWRNVGAQDFPFRRLGGAVFEIGCRSANAIVKLDNTLYFLGFDPESGITAVYRVQGHTPVKVSSVTVEESMERQKDTLERVEAFAYSERGQMMVAFRHNEFCWVMNHSTGLWSERESHRMSSWRIFDTVTFGDWVLALEYNGSRILEITPEAYDEDGDPLVATAVFPPLHAQERSMVVDWLELVMDGGHGLNIGQGSDPVVMVSASKDGGRTWLKEKQIPMGRAGQFFERCRAHRFGQCRNIMFRVSVSDPVPRNIIGATAEVDVA